MVEVTLKLTAEELVELAKFLKRTGIGTKEACCVKESILKSANGEPFPKKPPTP
jgi:hypothetical protein